LGEIFWPEIEFNCTHWSGGPRNGRNQVFLTPGLVVGRIPIQDRLKLVVGLGYQTAISSVSEAPATPTYNHAWILSVRTPF
jgi:hypothetical protein